VVIQISLTNCDYAHLILLGIKILYWGAKKPGWGRGPKTHHPVRLKAALKVRG
jgi:hypothetical protein